MGGNILLGTAKMDITPSDPISLAGYAHRTGSFEGISRRLYARAWLLEQSVKDDVRRALIIQADLIWWGPEIVRKLKTKLWERWGFDPASVILHASHTHSGPQTSGMFTSSLGEPNPEYLRLLESKLLDFVAEAQSNLESVQVYRGAGECRIGLHRRKQVEGIIRMAPNPEGPLDTEVSVIRFQTDEGMTKGVLFHYTCHPTVSADNLVSSEFPGVAMEALEEALGGGAIVSYLQGCCGDIRPDLVRDGEFYRGSDEDVRRLGGTLSDEVLRVLAEPMKPLAAIELSWRSCAVRLPYQQLPGRDKLQSLKHQQGVVGQWSTLLLDEPFRIYDGASLELSMLHIADGLSFLALNGEVVTAYGTFVKNETEGQVLPLAYSNGMIGYIPTAQQVAEGGYEALESTRYFGLPAPFEASLEQLICSGILQLIGKNGQNEHRLTTSEKHVNRSAD
jgi:hypothetical protein